jgi:putative transposase
MADLLIDVLRSGMRESKFVVHDFVVMPNHVHVLMTIPGGGSLEKAMQLIEGRFSFLARRELGFCGEVWQRGIPTCGSRMKKILFSIGRISSRIR